MFESFEVDALSEAVRAIGTFLVILAFNKCYQWSRKKSARKARFVLPPRRSHPAKKISANKDIAALPAEMRRYTGCSTARSTRHTTQQPSGDHDVRLDCQARAGPPGLTRPELQKPSGALPEPRGGGHDDGGAFSADVHANMSFDVAAEADLLVDAVRQGKMLDLPLLFDVSYAHACKSVGRGKASEEIATQLLASTLRASAARRRFRDAISVYSHVGARVGVGTARLWSLLLYCAVQARCHTMCAELWSGLLACGAPSEQDVTNMVRHFAETRNPLGAQAMLAAAVAKGFSFDTERWKCALAACAEAPGGAEVLQEIEAAKDVILKTT